MNQHLSFICLVLWLGITSSALASGSYRVAIPKPNLKAVNTTNLERDKFALGQQVFNGKTRLSSQAEPSVVTGQKLRLEKCQALLPSNVAKSKSLTDLAGQLTEEQLAALEYFLGQRYPAK